MGKRKSCQCGHSKLGLRIERGVLRWRARPEHRLQKPRGWAIQKSVLVFHAQRGDVTRVEIEDTETHTTFDAALTEFFVHGFVMDRGYGEQIALPLQSWHMADAGATSSVSAGADLQLVLFDMRRPE